MKQLKHSILSGIFFVLITGTLSHFLYEWTGNNFIVGLFTPVNESTWEHMKLLFFPMLLYSFIGIPKLKNACPNILPSFMTGILAGTLSIPVIFYTYTGILGNNLFFLDFMTFLLSVVFAFYCTYRLALSRKIQDCSSILYILTGLFIFCFWLFTCNPPNIGLFAKSRFHM